MAIDQARAAARERFKHLRNDGGEPTGVNDPENPPLSDDQLATMRPAHEVHPDLVAASIRRRGGRPKSVMVKKAVSVRLDPEVLEDLKAKGPGWQTSINDQLWFFKSLAAHGQEPGVVDMQNETDQQFIIRMKATRGMPTSSEVDRFRRIERDERSKRFQKVLTTNRKSESE